MRDTDVISLLKQLSDELESNYSYLNGGGCCCIAAMVQKAFYKYLPHIPTRIAVMGDRRSRGNIYKARAKIPPYEVHSKLSWRLEGISFTHVMIEFKVKESWYAFDSAGVTECLEDWNGYLRSEGYLLHDEATALADNPDGWNSMFNRDQLPMIQKRIENTFQSNLIPQEV